MKALTNISDRLVAWLVPQGTAHGDECQYVYWCQSRDCDASPIGRNRMRRLECAGGYVSYWKDYGCC